MRYALQIVLILFCYPSLFAQEYSVIRFTTDQGLPIDLTKAIVQDETGFIWIATDAGLVRYDGINFKVIEPSLGTAYIKSFTKSPEGKLFVIHDQGIHEIISRPDTTLFQQVLLANQHATDSTIVYPKEMYIDRNGRYWISERDAIAQFHQNKLHRFEFDKKNFSSSYVKSFSLFEDLNDNLWAVSYHGYLFYYDNSSDKFTELTLAHELGDVNDHLVLEKGKVWLATTTGVYELLTGPNAELKSITRISPRTDITSMLMTTRKEIFVGSFAQGLFKIVGNESSFAVEKVEGASQRFINNLVEQGDNLWITTDEGVGLLQRPFFKTIAIKEVTQYVQAIGLTGDVVYFSIGHSIYMATRTRENEYEVKGIKNVHDGYIAYLVPYANGVCFSDSNSSLYFLDQEGKTTKRIDLEGDSNAYFYTIFFITSDSHKNIWACRDHSTGVVKVTPDYTVVKYGPTQGLTSKVIVAKESGKGVMYFGSQGDSTYLYKYDPAKDRFINLSIPLKTEKPFSVNDIFIDENENVWMATDEGLYRYQDGKVSKVDLGKRLNDQVLKAILITDDKSIWLGTNTGVLKFSNGESVNLDESSGMPAKNINYRCLSEDADGRLWAGTSEGVTFTRAKSTQLEATPKPIFISFKINGDNINPKKNHSFSSNSYLQASFLSLSFPGNKTLYQTRLNSTSPWSEPLAKSEITIPELKGGTYLFQVRARKSGGYTWSEVASIPFQIKTAWYSQWWAVVLYLAGGISLLALIVQINSKRLIADKRRLEKVIDDRTKEILEKNSIINEQNKQLLDINQDLESKVNTKTREVSQAYQKLLSAHKELDTFVYKSAHDLRGPIARLLGLCHLAHLEMKEPDMVDYIDRLEQTSREMDHLLSRLIRTQEIKNKEMIIEPIEIKKVIEGIMDKLVSPEVKEKVFIKVNIPDRLVLNSDRFLMDILFENVLQNAVQSVNYARKDAYIRIEAILGENSNVIFTITDNGVGILAEAKRGLFEIFFRATRESGGSGLGLYEAKIICEKSNGHIRFNEDNVDETEFIIELPLSSSQQQEFFQLSSNRR